MPVIEWDEAKEVEWEDKREELRGRGGLLREELFDKAYWNGGGKVGGYAHGQFGETYMDFPAHWHTVGHILARRPESVLELGAARGYVLKKLQDHGIKSHGFEISKHCLMTRCCEWIWQQDLCQTPWKTIPDPDFKGRDLVFQDKFDLCVSVAALEHVPEEHLPVVIREMVRTCRRGLHGIDFGQNDDGFDKTHVSLFSRERWVQLFAEYAPGWPVEILDKEELERGVVPQEVLFGDGKIKLEVGSFTTMTPFGWTNIDVHDLAAYAQPRNYQYLRHDVRQGLPFKTGEVSAIHANHFLEHLSYKDGLSFLRECRRVLNPQTGALRLAVPDAEMLVKCYRNDLGGHTPDMDDFAEISDGVEAAPTAAGKLWELLFSGHLAAYDAETLLHALAAAGFDARVSALHSVAPDFKNHVGLGQIVRESVDTHPCLSLIVDAVCKVGETYADDSSG